MDENKTEESVFTRDVINPERMKVQISGRGFVACMIGVATAAVTIATGILTMLSNQSDAKRDAIARQEKGDARVESMNAKIDLLIAENKKVPYWLQPDEYKVWQEFDRLNRAFNPPLVIPDVDRIFRDRLK